MQIQTSKKASVYSKVAQVPFQVAFQIVRDISGNSEDRKGAERCFRLMAAENACE